MIPELRTERLIMRGWRNDDLDTFAPFWADPEASAYIGGPLTERGAAWRRMASYAGQWLLRGYGFWVLQRPEDKTPLGYCGLWHPDDWPEAEVGWSVLPRFQRQGYAGEAARAAIGYARALGWKTLISLINKQNIASRALAESLGARLDYEFEIHGKTAQVYRHSLSNELKTVS